MGSASDWYWIAADGRIYSSAQQEVVGAGDAGYLAFCRRARPTAWPRDRAGEQTIAALQEVIAPYGLWIDLRAYAADVRWRRETGGVVVAGVHVATDDRSKTMVIGARLAAIADPEWSTVWRAADGAIHTLGAAQVIAISDAVQAHVSDCFARQAQVEASIASGAITTIPEIDEAFAT